VIVSVMDVGGTHASAANVDLDTRSVVSGQPVRTPLDCAASAADIVSVLAGCAGRLPAGGPDRWAIALPGPFDYEHGIGRYVRMGKFDALCGHDLRAALSPLLPRAREVSFHNDADAFVAGEWWAGAARGRHRAAGITLGTGVGSGFLCDGRILGNGPGIPPDGRIDLLRYAGKPLEETVSRQAIRRAYARATRTASAPDVHEIAQRARQADRDAAQVFTRAFHALGTVLGPCLAAFAPTVLVIGGSIAASWDLVAEPLRAGLDEAGLGRIAVEPALRPAEAPLLGAAYLATHHRMKGNPP
jgi:glucokinase